MSEQTPAGAKKPATRKPAKKATGPTKAAALKKLGLSQDDLDSLKALSAARAAAGQVSAPEPVTEKPVAVKAPAAPVSPEKVKAYDALREAGLEVPAELKAEVEQYVAQKTEQEVPQAGPWFARNLRNMEFRMRLDRQKSPAKSTILNPRGSRGDLVKLQPEDLEDENLIANVQLGIIEIIPIQEARSVLEKQATNQQQAVHPAMALLRNELGKPYEQQSVEVVGDNSYTVAHLQPQGGEAGNLPSSGRGIDWQTARQGAPEGIISDGFAAADQAAQADALARRRDIEGPAAGLGGLSVSVAPVERT
jgi:hypothetical protein